MSKDKKELAELEHKLNGISNGNAKFSNIRETADGQYEMTVNLDANSTARNLFFGDPSQVKSLVKQRKVHPDSLLAKIYKSSDSDNFIKEVAEAGAKDILNSIDKARSLDEVKKTIKDVDNFNKTVASSLNQRYRDILSPTYLDLREKSSDETKATDLYKRSSQEYLKSGIYGTSIDLLSNFAATGFYNETADKEVKEFFDSWVQDTNFISIVGKIFHNLFKFSVAYLLPAVGPYEPHNEGLSSIPGKSPKGDLEKANMAFVLNRVLKNYGHSLDFEKFSKKYDRVFKETAQTGTVQIGYMLLDPRYVVVESSGAYGGETITVTKKGLQGIKDIEERKKKGHVSKKEDALYKLIPSKIRDAAKKGEDYVDIDGYISSIYLRKDDFESFAKPRGARVFDSLDFKDELRKADYATLDGVFNYILKVTVGDKDNQVTDLSTLNALAEAFNTPQKAFTVVWNHTLDIEKITSPEIGQILGNSKYEPVEKDITAALGMSRALIDGENVSAAAGILTSKAIQSEINFARQQVEAWIYTQYKNIAKGAGFDNYPVVRWAQFVISTDGDAVSRASWMQLVDRQLVSRQTAMKAIGLDPAAELGKLEEEVLMRQQGIGIQGSPFQQSPSTVTLTGPVEPQETVPSGDQGRPAGQPTTTKDSVDQVKVVKRKTKVQSPSQQDTQVTKVSKSTINTDLLKILESLSEDEQNNITTVLNTAIKNSLITIEDGSYTEVEELYFKDKKQDFAALKQPRKGLKVSWIIKGIKLSGVIKEIYVGTVDAIINGKRVTRTGTPKYPVLLIESSDGSQYLMSAMARTLEKVVNS